MVGRQTDPESAPPRCGGTPLVQVRRGTSPTLPGGANLESPSEWLHIRAPCSAGKGGAPDGCGGRQCRTVTKTYVAGMQRAIFHLAACQMKLIVSAPTGAAIFEPSRWRLKVSPTWKGGGQPRWTFRHGVPPNGGADSGAICSPITPLPKNNWDTCGIIAQALHYIVDGARAVW